MAVKDPGQSGGSRWYNECAAENQSVSGVAVRDYWRRNVCGLFVMASAPVTIMETTMHPANEIDKIEWSE